MEDIIDIEPEEYNRPNLQVVGEKLRPFTPLTPREFWVYSVPESPTFYKHWIQIASGWLGGTKNNKNAKNWFGRLEQYCPEWYLQQDGFYTPMLLVELIKIQEFTQEQTVLRQVQTIPVELAEHFYGETQSVRIINELIDGAYTSELAPNPSKVKGWSHWERLAVERWTTYKTASAITTVPTEGKVEEELIEPEELDLSGGQIARVSEIQGWRSQFEAKGSRRERAYLKSQKQRGRELRLAGEEAIAEGFKEMDEMLDADS